VGDGVMWPFTQQLANRTSTNAADRLAHASPSRPPVALDSGDAREDRIPGR
jgi:hypothetical protein